MDPKPICTDFLNWLIREGDVDRLRTVLDEKPPGEILDDGWYHPLGTLMLVYFYNINIPPVAMELAEILLRDPRFEPFIYEDCQGYPWICRAVTRPALRELLQKYHPEKVMDYWIEKGAR
jgi:hypothetical protein